MFYRHSQRFSDVHRCSLMFSVKMFSRWSQGLLRIFPWCFHDVFRMISWYLAGLVSLLGLVWMVGLVGLVFLVGLVGLLGSVGLVGLESRLFMVLWVLVVWWVWWAWWVCFNWWVWLVWDAKFGQFWVFSYYFIWSKSIFEWKYQFLIQKNMMIPKLLMV